MIQFLERQLELLVAKMEQPQRLPVLRADMARERVLRAQLKVLALA